MIRKLLLLIISVFIYSLTFTQKAIISTLNTRVLFFEVDNPINVAMPGFDCDEIILESSDCDISGKDCNYNVTPHWVETGFAYTTLYIYQRSNHKKLDSLNVKTITIPEPRVKIIIGHGMFSRNGPIVYMDCDRFDLDLKIIDFEITIQRGKDTLYSHTNIGALYTEKSLKEIEKMQVNDSITITNIRIAGKNNLHWTVDYGGTATTIVPQ